MSNTSENEVEIMSDAERNKIAVMLQAELKNPEFNIRIWVGLNRGKDLFEVFFAKVVKVIEEYPFSPIEKGMLLSKASKCRAEALEQKTVITKITSSEWRKEESSNRRSLYKEFENSTDTVQEFCTRKAITVEKLRSIVNECSKYPKEIWSSRFESSVKSYTDEELEIIYLDWVACGKALSVFAKDKKIAYATIKSYCERAHKEEYEKYRESGSTIIDYEDYFQVWLTSGKSLTLFCQEQCLVYKNFRDFVIDKHNGEYEKYKLELQAKMGMSEESVKACQKAYKLKVAHPEWTIAKVCCDTGCDRSQFTYWLKKEGKDVKPSFVARAENVMNSLRDPKNHDSIKKLFTDNKITKDKFIEWALHERVWFELPEYFQNANPVTLEQELELAFQGLVRGLTPDEVCERNKGLRKEVLKIFVTKHYPEYEKCFAEKPKVIEEICVAANVEILKEAGISEIPMDEQPKAESLDETPVIKAPVVEEIIKENNLEVVEVKAETKEEDPAKEVISEKLSNLSDNLEEIKTLFAKMTAPKEDVVDSFDALCKKQDAEKVTISGNVVKEILAKVQELENLKTKLKANLS